MLYTQLSISIFAEAPNVSFLLSNIFLNLHQLTQLNVIIFNHLILIFLPIQTIKVKRPWPTLLVSSSRRELLVHVVVVLLRYPQRDLSIMRPVIGILKAASHPSRHHLLKIRIISLVVNWLRCRLLSQSPSLIPSWRSLYIQSWIGVLFLMIKAAEDHSVRVPSTSIDVFSLMKLIDLLIKFILAYDFVAEITLYLFFRNLLLLFKGIVIDVMVC